MGTCCSSGGSSSFVLASVMRVDTLIREGKPLIHSFPFQPLSYPILCYSNLLPATSISLSASNKAMP